MLGDAATAEISEPRFGSGDTDDGQVISAGELLAVSSEEDRASVVDGAS
jgi:hypothetical protein